MTRCIAQLQACILYLSTLFLSLTGGTVSGPATFQGAVTLNGNTTIQNANVVGNANFLGTVNANGKLTANSGLTSNANVLIGSSGVLSWSGSSMQVQCVSSPGNLFRLFGPSFPGFLIGGTSDTTGISLQWTTTQTGLNGLPVSYGQVSGGGLGANAGSLGMRQIWVDALGTYANKQTILGLDSNANVQFFGSGGQNGVNTQASYNIKSVEGHPALSGPTTTILQIPAGADVRGVSCRVNTTVTGATTWSLGDGTTATRWASSKADSVGTTVTSADYSSTGLPAFFNATTNLVATANGSNFTGGVIRCVVFYGDASPPTG
jgi:hypothetical protein